MITLQTSILAPLVGTLEQVGKREPAQVQRPGSDDTLAPIDSVVPARARVVRRFGLRPTLLAALR